MDLAQEIKKIAVEIATKHGIKVPPSGKCVYEEPEPIDCKNCLYCNFCTTLSICQVNIIGALVHNAQPNVLEDIDMNFMLVALGIEPMIKEY